MKNGSNTRAITSGGMPMLVSVTHSQIIALPEVLHPGGSFVEPLVGDFDSDAASYRHRILSVDAEPQQRVFELGRVDQHRLKTAGDDGFRRDAGPTVRWIMSCIR